ncbi:hypothetical protein BKA63DRAFT_422327 [Paraphoma chrysanthemicola]|nr:hypothetical protein BKA63DRAFT_422327 [Paraphoma chrysanthemicola]
MKSHHDQGRIHVPLHIHGLADPEPLDRIIDLNLGNHSITPCGRTEAPFDGESLLGIFNMFAMKRKELMCQACFRDHEAKGFAPCSCTFRKRFLDRWLCIPCYVKENEVESQRRVQAVIETEPGHVHALTCRCGATIAIDDDYMAICTWCNGEVDYEEDPEPEQAENADEHIDNANSVDDEQDDNLALAPAEQLPQHMYSAYNKDGTVSVFYEHKRIMGEPLGHAMILQEARRRGIDLPCTCCRCPVPDHNCGSGHSIEMGEVEDDMDDMDTMEAEGMEAGSDGDVFDFGGGIDFDEDNEAGVDEEDDAGSEDDVEPELSED